MKKVYICSRYKGTSVEVQKRLQLARIYSRIAWDKGFFPIAPHLYLPQFLDDGNKTERGAALKLGIKALKECAEVWVFGESYSNGMKKEIERAQELKKPIKYFDQRGEPL